MYLLFMATQNCILPTFQRYQRKLHQQSHFLGLGLSTATSLSFSTKAANQDTSDRSVVDPSPIGHWMKRVSVHLFLQSSKFYY